VKEIPKSLWKNRSCHGGAILARTKKYQQVRKTIVFQTELWKKECAEQQNWKHEDLWNIGFNERFMSDLLPSEALTKLAQEMREEIESKQKALIHIERRIVENQIVEQAKAIKQNTQKTRTEIWDGKPVIINVAPSVED
jgi:hypothetical protein